jgi:hypothetical protein
MRTAVSQCFLAASPSALGIGRAARTRHQSRSNAVEFLRVYLPRWVRRLLGAIPILPPLPVAARTTAACHCENSQR